MRHPDVEPGVHARKRVTVIANGTAGQGGCAEGWPEEVSRHCAALGLDAQVVLVQGGQGIEDAVDAAVKTQPAIVVAAGGDGTVSAVASRLAGTGMRMGVLPMGTLNHFAKDLRIPLDLEGAVNVLASGRELAVDVGEVNGRIFVNNSSLGLYPDIVRDRDLQRRRLGRSKWPALFTASLHALRRYPVLTFRIEIDGQSIVRRSAFAFIGNNEYQMEGFNIGEREGLTDGKLSLYVSQRVGRFGLVRLAFRALVGRLKQASDFDVVTAASLVVDTRLARMRVATDGEITWMDTPLKYRVRPADLRVMVPAQA